MNNFRAQLGLIISSLLFLSACGGADQVSQIKDKAGDIQKTAEQAQGAITALASSQAGLMGMKDGVAQTITAVKAGDFTKAQQEFGKIQETWKGLEAGLKGVSAEGTQKVQNQLQTVATGLEATSPDAAKLTTDLQGLTTSIGSLATGGGELVASGGAKAADFQSNLTAMKDALGQATTAVEASDFAAAKDSFGTAKQTWYKFGGGVKQQSADTYQKLDSGIKTVSTALNTASPQKDAVLGDLKTLSGELDTVSTGK